MNPEWYYHNHHGQQGPVSTSEIHALMRQGILNNQSNVWRQGMANWEPISQIPELKPQMSQPATSVHIPTQKNGPDAIDKIIGMAFKSGAVIVLLLIGFFGWKYWQDLNEPKGPSYGWLHERYSKTKHEDFIESPRTGEWTRVRVVGGGNYELRITKLNMAEIEYYESTGEMNIPVGVMVFVWDIHRIIERRSTGTGTHGAPPREEKHVRLHVWRNPPETQGKHPELYGMRETPIPADS